MSASLKPAPRATETDSLTALYTRIGISAVAAAAPYARLVPESAPKVVKAQPLFENEPA